MIPLQTQSAAYWESFAVTSDDLDYLANYLKANGPRSIDDLAIALIEHRCRQEEQALVYQPRNAYEVGQRLVFPALDFRVGTVQEIRPGFNPEHGDFTVIRVALEGEQCLREFAASLRTPHKLNRPEGQDGTLLDSQGLRPPAELYADVAAPVRQRLLERLRAGDAHDFVEVDEQWLLREMMADVHIGHLNLAEAAIEERNAPISTGDLPKVIELPAEIPPAIRSFSNVPLPCEQRGADEAERQRAVEEQRRKEAEWQARLRAEQEAKPVPAEQQPKVEQQVRSAEIQRICRERRITELVHFTRIQNLRSILEHGLVGRNVLTQ